MRLELDWFHGDAGNWLVGDQSLDNDIVLLTSSEPGLQELVKPLHAAANPLELINVGR